jgi:RNA polymerase sigma-70 factor (ECF subfamily)
MRAFMHLDGFLGKSKISTWISRIAINAALAKIRTRRRKQFSIDDLVKSSWNDWPPEIVSDRPAPDRERWERELARIFPDSPGQLSPDLFSAAELHYFNELSAQECARVIGSSLSNVKVRIFRAKLRLWHGLDKHFRQRALPASCNSSVGAHHRVRARRASSYREGKQHRICLRITEDAREPGTGTGSRSISFTAR